MLKKVLAVWIILIMAFSFVLVSTQNTKGVTTEINEDHYIYDKTTFDSGDKLEVSVEVDVTDGPNIDVWVMSEIEFDNYEHGDSFDYIPALSKEDTAYWQAEETITEKGTYYIVIDNTDTGEASPPANLMDDPATVDYHFNTEVIQEDTGDGGDTGDDGSTPAPGIGLFVLGISSTTVIYRVYKKKQK